MRGGWRRRGRRWINWIMRIKQSTLELALVLAAVTLLWLLAALLGN